MNINPNGINIGWIEEDALIGWICMIHANILCGTPASIPDCVRMDCIVRGWLESYPIGGHDIVALTDEGVRISKENAEKWGTRDMLNFA